ncbi:MAG: hypothetical protein ACRC8A_04140 [Microcoleaceae cyanobacterium]
MSLTLEIFNALQGDNPTEHYNRIAQLRQKHSSQELQEAATELDSENRQKFEWVTHQMFYESEKCQELIQTLELFPISDLEDWLNHYFGKYHLEHLTPHELLKAHELMTEFLSFEDFTELNPSDLAPVTKGEVCQLDMLRVRLDGNTQPREMTDETTIYAYQQDLEQWVEIPPIVVFYDGEDYWLADGFHRYYAHVRADRAMIYAEIHPGSRRDAVLYSVGANTKHGLRCNNADKRRAVLTLLRDEEWLHWSDREIAKQCGVAHITVGRLRAELSGTFSRSQDEEESLSGTFSRSEDENVPPGEKLSGTFSRSTSENSSSSNDTPQVRTFIRNGKSYTMRTGNINKERKNAQEGGDPTWLQRSQQPEEITRTQCANFTYDCNNDSEAIARTLTQQLATRRKFKAVLDAMNQIAESPPEIWASIIPDYDPNVDW